jgi:iron complex transport system substrate-binding protein
VPTLSRIIFLFFLSIFLVTSITVHAAEVNGAVTVTDFRGKKLTLAKPARRIVCLIESALSGLYMLGAEQSVVGVSANIYNSQVFSWYAELDERIRRKKIPAPGNWDFVNIESVIALKPDLVIIWSKQTESISALEERGIPVFGVFLSGGEDVYREMSALGVLTGRGKRAAELVAYTKQEIERFTRRVNPLPASHRPGVYYMWAQGNLETSCGGSTVNDLINLAGGRNVCAAIDREHLAINLEKVLVWNPDLIVMWYNERKTPQDIIADPQWRSIRAIRTRRVHEFPEVFLCDLWTLKYQYAVKMVAKWANPELFRDIDLEQENRSMLFSLYGRKFKGVR